MSAHPIRIPPESLVRIGGVEHRLREVTEVGWVLDVVGQPGVTLAITVDELRREALEPDFRLDPHGARPGRDKARSVAGAREFGDLPRVERPGVVFRRDCVKRFLALEKAGAASRSDAGMDAAAALIVQELERERVEANERTTAASAPQGRRERHDSKPKPGVREAPVRPFCGRTLLRWTRRYVAGGRTALALRHRYRLSGRREFRHESDVRELLAEAVKGYASMQRPTRVACHRDLRASVHALNVRRGAIGRKGFRCPSRTTLDAEIGKIGKFELHAARHGETAALRKYGPNAGGIEVTRAGERIEIDEWRVHAMTLLKHAGIWQTLDAAWRRTAQRHRLNVCVALCAASRAIVGTSFSDTDNTTENAVACLAMVLADKTPLAKWAGATSPWPMACTPEEVVTDGGAGFTSADFETAVTDLTSDSDTTPGGQPQHRARVERFFRTAGQRFEPFIPGRTFSNPVERGDYDSKDRAAIIDELLRKLFVIFVCDVYHRSPHDGLSGATPFDQWESLDGEAAPIVPRGSELRRNALGVQLRRTLGRDGVRVLGLDFSSGELQRLFRHKPGIEVDVRLDPADLGRVSVRLPDGYLEPDAPVEGVPRRWIACPCQQRGMEGTPVDAWVAAEQDLRRRHGERAALSEATMLEAILKMKAMVAGAETQFGLGGARPSLEQIDRLERQIRMTFPPRHGLGRPEPGPRDLRAVAIPRGTPVDVHAVTGTDGIEEAADVERGTNGPAERRGCPIPAEDNPQLAAERLDQDSAPVGAEEQDAPDPGRAVDAGTTPEEDDDGEYIYRIVRRSDAGDC